MGLAFLVTKVDFCYWRRMIFAFSITTLVVTNVAKSSAEPPDDVWTSPSIAYASNPFPASTLPSVVHYNVLIDDTVITLRLQKRQDHTANVPVYEHLDGKIVLARLSDEPYENLGFYQDVATMAAVTLRINPDTTAECHDLDGTFCHLDSCYRIQPLKQDQQTSAFQASPSPSGSHVVNTLDVPTLGSDFVVAPPEGYHTPGRANSNDSIEYLHITRTKRTVKPHYEIELLYVADYAMYQRWATDMQNQNPQVTRLQVLQAMRYYLAQVENAVDLNYRSIVINDWSIGTKLVCIYIATTPESSSWTESLKPLGATGTVTVDSLTALSNYRYWVANVSGTLGLPVFDHAALFTGYNIDYAPHLFYPSNRINLWGLAYIGGLCGDSRESIIAYLGSLTEGLVQAHELGHSLNAQHDSLLNTCLADDQYIMTAVIGTPTATNAHNHFHFSECSITYFRNFIYTLNGQNQNCLLNSGSYFNDAEWLYDILHLPGQVYNVDQQCQQAFGQSFAHLGGATYGAEMCWALRCYNTSAPPKPLLIFNTHTGSAEGTTCGNHRWCYQGECIYNASAPEASDTCPIGDLLRTSFVISNTPFKCSNMPAYYCYDQSVSDACCGACSQIFNVSRTACEYGDKQDCTGTTLLSCNYDKYRQVCCNSCEAIKLSIPGCPWGDTDSGCANLVGTGFCSTSPLTCCESCVPFRSTTLYPTSSFSSLTLATTSGSSPKTPRSSRLTSASTTESLNQISIFSRLTLALTSGSLTQTPRSSSQASASTSRSLLETSIFISLTPASTSESLRQTSRSSRATPASTEGYVSQTSSSQTSDLPAGFRSSTESSKVSTLTPLTSASSSKLTTETFRFCGNFLVFAFLFLRTL